MGYVNVILVFTFTYLAIGMLITYSTFSDSRLLSQIEEMIPEELPESTHGAFMVILMASMILLWPMHLPGMRQ